MATRTIALDSKNLQGGIEALSSAARAFQLTPFERGAHRALMVSVDVAVGSFVAFVALIGIIAILAARGLEPKDFTPVQQAFVFAPLAASTVAFAFAVVVGTVSLALNIPLLRKFYRERARLKELGLSSLSESLWKESRRGRWISRARGVLLTVVGIFMFFGFFGGVVASLVGLMTPTQMTEFEGEIESEWEFWLWGALFYATMAVLIFSARYLQNQRERMELTASAEELKKALETLRQHAGNSEVVPVPSELLEQAARIESAQIAKERKDAVLQSVAARPTGYAITFDPDAAKDRATLGVADRVELEDLVAQLSTGGAQFESQPGAVAGAEGATLRGITKSQRVECDYVIDQASHGIRIIAVRHGGGGSHSSPNGHGHA
jgi:hypothetical protein